MELVATFDNQPTSVVYNSSKPPACLQFCYMAKSEQKKEIPDYAVELGKHLRYLRKEKKNIFEIEQH